MSYKKIYKIEENLRSKKVATPDDIALAKNELMVLKNQNEISLEDLKNTKIRYQGQLQSPPALSNSLAISAVALSLTTTVFSVSDFNENAVKIGFLVVLLASLAAMFILLFNNTAIYKKAVTYTVMIALIDEVLN